MAKITPYINQRAGRQNQPIIVPTENLLVDPVASTFITVDVDNTNTAITVKNINKFAANQILLIGELGNGNAEINYVSGTPSNNTITLQFPLVFPHGVDTPVTTLYYDQVQFWTAATETGAKSLLSTGSILGNYDSTNYNDLTVTSGFYFARFRDAIGSTVSNYSAPSPVDGYDMFSARAVIDVALGMINKQTSNVFSDEYAFQMIDACQMETLREFKRWSFMQSFNTIIGTTAEGTWKIAVPDDLDDTMTYKSIYNFRIGKEPDMIWVDKAEFDAIVQGVAFSTVSTAANAGATSLVLTSSKDFNSDGAIQIASLTTNYSANDKATNTLTTDPLGTNVPANQDVFQFGSLGNPAYWTIWDGYIYHWPIVSSVYTGRNYWMDYYKKLVQTTTDYQSIVLPDPTVVQYYLAWKFLLRMNNGEETTASKGFYDNYILRREKMKQKESLNRNFVLSPDLNGYGYGYWGN